MKVVFSNKNNKKTTIATQQFYLNVYYKHKTDVIEGHVTGAHALYLKAN